MRRLCIVLVLALSMEGASHGQVKLWHSAAIAFATVEEGRRILTVRDECVERMSPFDRSARMKTDREISEKEYLEFVARNVLAWEETEKEKVQSVLQFIRPKLEKLPLVFPEKILLIKTTGSEEGNAAYTRGNAVVLPKGELAAGPQQLQRLITHELFHVMTRHDPKLRDGLYRAIGFEKCDEIAFPATLRSRKITNPDAPRNAHRIRVRVRDEAVWVVPILFSSTEKYDLGRGGEFFAYLEFQFLVVAKSDGAGGVAAAYDSRNPRLIGVDQMSGFFEQVGTNTGYIIHPEEILADNFALLVLEETDVRSPEVLKKMREVLSRRERAEPEPRKGGTPNGER